MSRSFEMPDADWATVGTVGEPGHRTFYLQVRQAGDLVTLKLEKQQVATLAQFLGEILSDLPTPDLAPGLASSALVEPVEAEWAIGRIQLAYESSTDRIMIIADEIGFESDEDDPLTEPPADTGSGRIGLSRTLAAQIAQRGLELIGQGRPNCPLCGYPIEPEGHSCPKTNGHKAPAI